MHTALILGLCHLLTVTSGFTLSPPSRTGNATPAQSHSPHSTASTAPPTGAFVLGRLMINAPDVSVVGETEVFFCSLSYPPARWTVLYELLQNNGTVTHGEYSAHGREVAQFTLWIRSPSYEGHYSCRASVQNQSAVPATVSDAHYFRVIEPVEGAELVSVPPLAEVFEGSGLTLACSVRQGNRVFYEWSLNGEPVATSRHTATANRLALRQATLEDAGNYSCKAWNRLNDSHIYFATSHLLVKVKVPVSKPRMSFTVHKEGDVLLAHVTCWLDRGTPPVNLALYNRTGEALVSRETDRLHTVFSVPIHLSRRAEGVWCRAANGDRPVASDVLTLEVVPVGGAVTLKPEYIKHNFEVVGLILHCTVERGTFPSIQWFLNDTSLYERGDFYRIEEPSRALVLTSITASSSGFYHCVATDSFDSTNRITSERLLIDGTAQNLISVVALAVVLACFLFLVCLVTVCCVYGVIYRRTLSPLKPRPTFITDMESEDEEPIEEEYMEDVELMKAPNIEDADQREEDSLEEWPDLERALTICCMDENTADTYT